jgi:Exo-beta-D-glucosaminidase Ig-fold domain
MWQILSSDYDTQASYYGVKKASEPIHVQLNLPDLRTAVINNTTRPLRNLTLQAAVFSSTGKQLSIKKTSVDAPPVSESESFVPDLPPQSASDLVFIKLELRDESGHFLSDNFYWHAGDPSTYRKLNDLGSAAVTASATQLRSGEWVRVTVDLSNSTSRVALMTKLTIQNASDQTRVLPAYASDNYVSLLPGEKRSLVVECPASAVKGPLQIALRGCNVPPIAIQTQSR